MAASSGAAGDAATASAATPQHAAPPPTPSSSSASASASAVSAKKLWGALRAGVLLTAKPARSADLGLSPEFRALKGQLKAARNSAADIDTELAAYRKAAAELAAVTARLCGALERAAAAAGVDGDSTPAATDGAADGAAASTPPAGSNLGPKTPATAAILALKQASSVPEQVAAELADRLLPDMHGRFAQAVATARELKTVSYDALQDRQAAAERVAALTTSAASTNASAISAAAGLAPAQQAFNSAAARSAQAVADCEAAMVRSRAEYKVLLAKALAGTTGKLSVVLAPRSAEAAGAALRVGATVGYVPSQVASATDAPALATIAAPAGAPLAAAAGTGAAPAPVTPVDDARSPLPTGFVPTGAAAAPAEAGPAAASSSASSSGPAATSSSSAATGDGTPSSGSLAVGAAGSVVPDALSLAASAAASASHASDMYAVPPLPPHLPGETVLLMAAGVRDEMCECFGTLVATNYRLQWFPAPAGGSDSTSASDAPEGSGSARSTAVASSTGGRPRRGSFFDLPCSVAVERLAAAGGEDQPSAPDSSSAAGGAADVRWRCAYRRLPYISVPLLAIARMQVVGGSRGSFVCQTSDFRSFSFSFAHAKTVTINGGATTADSPRSGAPASGGSAGPDTATDASAAPAAGIVGGPCSATAVLQAVEDYTWVTAPLFPHVYRFAPAATLAADSLLQVPSSGAGATKVAGGDAIDGWSIFHADTELRRMLAHSPRRHAFAYRLSTVNETYHVCPTYPSQLILPATVTDELAIQAAKFRSKRRLPAVVWFCGSVTLSRASQPMAGMFNARSSHDEALLAAFKSDPSDRVAGTGSAPAAPEAGAAAAAAGPPSVDSPVLKPEGSGAATAAPVSAASSAEGASTKPAPASDAPSGTASDSTAASTASSASLPPSSILLTIFDARPRLNALGNAARGGGSESAGNYASSELIFLGIDNIHVVRDALRDMRTRILADHNRARQQRVILQQNAAVAASSASGDAAADAAAALSSACSVGGLAAAIAADAAAGNGSVAPALPACCMEIGAGYEYVDDGSNAGSGLTVVPRRTHAALPSTSAVAGANGGRSGSFAHSASASFGGSLAETLPAGSIAADDRFTSLASTTSAVLREIDQALDDVLLGASASSSSSNAGGSGAPPSGRGLAVVSEEVLPGAGGPECADVQAAAGRATPVDSTYVDGIDDSQDVLRVRDLDDEDVDGEDDDDAGSRAIGTSASASSLKGLADAATGEPQTPAPAVKPMLSPLTFSLKRESVGNTAHLLKGSMFDAEPSLLALSATTGPDVGADATAPGSSAAAGGSTGSGAASRHRGSIVVLPEEVPAGGTNFAASIAGASAAARATSAVTSASSATLPAGTPIRRGSISGAVVGAAPPTAGTSSTAAAAAAGTPLKGGPVAASGSGGSSAAPTTGNGGIVSSLMRLASRATPDALKLGAGGGATPKPKATGGAADTPAAQSLAASGRPRSSVAFSGNDSSGAPAAAAPAAAAAAFTAEYPSSSPGLTSRMRSSMDLRTLAAKASIGSASGAPAAAAATAPTSGAAAPAPAAARETKGVRRSIMDSVMMRTDSTSAPAPPAQPAAAAPASTASGASGSSTSVMTRNRTAFGFGFSLGGGGKDESAPAASDGGSAAASGTASSSTALVASARGARTVSGPADSLVPAAIGAVEVLPWLKLVSILLTGGVRVARRLSAGISVFVHCSDGWDRTAGLTSLGQLLIDPHFRTLQGFCTLVEKEWCSFGHRFARRCGTGGTEHHRSDHKDDQRAPIFLQWLDAVWQIWRQMPHAFEFNDRLLVALAEHCYSGRFGTFLYDCERERSLAKVMETTVAMWTYVLHPTNRATFCNPVYAACKHGASTAITSASAGAAADGLFHIGDDLLVPIVTPEALAVWPYWTTKWT